MRVAYVIATLAVALLPEVLKVVNDERQRRHDAEQRERDRQKDLAVASIAAERKGS